MKVNMMVHTYIISIFSICHFCPFRTITELEAQLDYERLRRERLEAQLDEYRREMQYNASSRRGSRDRKNVRKFIV